MKAMDRIRKLLALSESPYDAEASLALEKAQVLLIKQGLTISDLLEESKVIELSISYGKHIQPWEERLLKCILSATFTEAIQVYDKNEQELIIIGREANVITAKILYEYLHETVKRKAEVFRDSIEDLESFRIGMVDSIRTKFKEKAIQHLNKQSDSTNELKHVFLRETEEYIEEHYGTPENKNSWYGVDPNSYGLGKGIGKKISIDQQLSSEKKK